MIKHLKSLYNNLKKRLCQEYLRDEISDWIFDYENDLYKRYVMGVEDED